MTETLTLSSSIENIIKSYSITYMYNNYFLYDKTCTMDIKPHSKFDASHGIVHSILMTDILSNNFRIKIKMVIVFFYENVSRNN